MHPSPHSCQPTAKAHTQKPNAAARRRCNRGAQSKKQKNKKIKKTKHTANQSNILQTINPLIF